MDAAGNIKIVGASATCKPTETAVDWNVQGVKGDKGDQGLPGAKGDTGAMGPPGTFTGSFISPNQLYSLTVADTGIELSGPYGRMTLGDSGMSIESVLALSIRSSFPMLIKSDTTMDIQSSATMDITSGTQVTVESVGPVFVTGGPVVINGVPQ